MSASLASSRLERHTTHRHNATRTRSLLRICHRSVTLDGRLSPRPAEMHGDAVLQPEDAAVHQTPPGDAKPQVSGLVAVMCCPLVEACGAWFGSGLARVAPPTDGSRFPVAHR